MTFTLGDYIQTLRERKGLTTRELGRRAGLNYETIRKIETGYTKSPGLEAVIEISKALNVHPLNLILAYQGIDPEKQKGERNMSDDQIMAEGIKEFLEWRKNNRTGE